MKQKITEHRRFGTKMIIEEVNRFFFPEGGSNFQLGDFVREGHNIIGSFNQMRETYYRGIEDKSLRAAQIMMDDFHDDLLIYAEHLLSANLSPLLYPCATTIMGCVAADKLPQPTVACSATHRERIKELFALLDAKISENQDQPHIKRIEYEAYYCGASRVAFESALSQTLHGAIDNLMSETAMTDMPAYINNFVLAAQYANITPSGSSLLLAHFESLVAATDEMPVVDVLLRDVMLSGSLAPAMPPHSMLARSIIACYSEAWDGLFIRDQDKAILELEQVQNYCDHYKSPNPQFVALVEEKAQYIKLYQEQISVFEPAPPKNYQKELKTSVARFGKFVPRS